MKKGCEAWAWNTQESVGGSTEAAFLLLRMVGVYVTDPPGFQT